MLQRAVPALVLAVALLCHATTPARAQSLAIPVPSVSDPLLENLSIPGDAATRGMWSSPASWPLVAIHLGLLPDGMVISYGTPLGEGVQDGRTIDVWNPFLGLGGGSHASLPNAQGVNSFCSGGVVLPSGLMLISGGNEPLESTIFDYRDTTAVAEPSALADERWYATMTALPDGRALITGGVVPYASLYGFENPSANLGVVSMTPEIYEPGTGWRTLFGANSRDAFGPDHNRWWYPRQWVAPGGGVFGISSEKLWLLDPDGSGGNGSIQILADFKTGVSEVTRPNIGPTSTAVMYDTGRILQVGGNGYTNGHATSSSTSATTFDLTAGGAPVVAESAAMSFARQWAQATVLPDGRVVVTGGTRFADNGGNDAVYTAEIWDPDTGGWTLGADAARIRNYHSTAILLPSGAVLSGGGGVPGPVTNFNVEVYYPPYLFEPGGSALAARPQLLSLSHDQLDYGQSFQLELASAGGIDQAVLIGLSSTTHSFNQGQRLYRMAFSQLGAFLDLTAPPNGQEAPPGYYLLFVVDDAGVPSRGVVVAVGDDTLPPVPPGPALSLPPNQGSAAGATVSLQLVASSPTATPLAFSAEGLPTGLAIDPLSGEIAGTIDERAVGSWAVSVTATDAVGVATVEFSWNVLVSGLFAYWPLDGNGEDLSGAGNTLLLQGDAGFAPGQKNQALALDGAGDYAVSQAALGLANDDPWSISLWTLPADQPAGGSYGQGVVGWGASGTNNGNFLYYNADEQTFEVGFYGNDAQTAASHPPDAWYHAVVTFDGAEQRVYIDGELALSRATGTLGIDDSPVQIGRDPFGQSRHLEGLIDEVRIYGYGLSPGEVDALYGDGPVAPPGGGGAPRFGGSVVGDADPSIDYGVGPWIHAQDPAHADGDVHVTDVAGAQATFAFEGTRVAVYGGLAEDAGRFDLYLDDILRATVDQYAPLPRVYGQQLWDSGPLPSGAHTLRIVARGDAQPASAGTWVQLDQIEVDRVPALSDPGAQLHYVGVAVSLGPVGSDPEGQPLTWSASSLPAGLAIDPATGVVSGTPLVEAQQTVSLSATDAAGGTAGLAFDWQIVAPAPLTVDPIATAPSPVASPVLYVASASGNDALEYKWSFGDGNETAWSTSPIVEHSFDQPGRHTVELLVTDRSEQEVLLQLHQLVHLPLTTAAPAHSSPILYDADGGAAGRVWNVNPDNDSVTVFDLALGTVVAEVAVGNDPRSIARAPDGRMWVTLRKDAGIDILETEPPTRTDRIALPAGSRPFGLSFDPVGVYAFVALEGLGALQILDPSDGSPVAAVDVGASPRGVSVDAAGSRVYVSRFVTPPLPGEDGASPLAGAGGGEVVVVDPDLAIEAGTIVLAHSDAPRTTVSGPGLPNYLGPLVVSPDGVKGFVPSKQDNILGGGMRSGPDLTFDQTVRSIVSQVDLASELEDPTERVDLDNAGRASAAHYDRWGNHLFVALEPSREVAVVDVHTHSELLRFDVGLAPQGLALSDDGLTLFVYNFMGRSVQAFALGDLLLAGDPIVPLLWQYETVAAEGEALSPAVLQGKRLFYDARDPRLARDGYMSCASCHVDGGQDGRSWDFSQLGEGIRNTIELNGRAGTRQGPVHWSANFDETHDFEGQIRSFAEGTGLMDDLDFSATSHPLGSAKAPVAGPDLDALAAYLASLRAVGPAPTRAADGSHSPAAERGRAVFLTRGCAECHVGPNFTDSGTGGVLGGVHDVGTLRATSGSRLGAALPGIDTPTLRGLWATAPYLHDGRAATVADAVLAHAGVEVAGAELDDLIAYLLEIDDAERIAMTVPLPGRLIGLVIAATALWTVRQRARAHAHAHAGRQKATHADPT